MPPAPDHAAAPAAPSVRESMRAWRADHPHATFAEIEVEATHQVAALRAALITDALATGDAVTAPTCGTCGRAMVRNGIHTRAIITSHQEPVRVTGYRYRCSVCGTALSPPR